MAVFHIFGVWQPVDPVYSTLPLIQENVMSTWPSLICANRRWLLPWRLIWIISLFSRWHFDNQLCVLNRPMSSCQWFFSGIISSGQFPRLPHLIKDFIFLKKNKAVKKNGVLLCGAERIVRGRETSNKHPLKSLSSITDGRSHSCEQVK